MPAVISESVGFNNFRVTIFNARTIGKGYTRYHTVRRLHNDNGDTIWQTHERVMTIEKITPSCSPSPLIDNIRVSNLYSSVITLCLADISLEDFSFYLKSTWQRITKFLNYFHCSGGWTLVQSQKGERVFETDRRWLPRQSITVFVGPTLETTLNV